MKYSAAFERDWNFYLANRKKFMFSGELPPKIVCDEQGVEAKRAFHSLDSQGKLLSTCEPELLAEVIVCKKSINMHIKQWAEGYEDCFIGRQEYLEEFLGDVPEWVVKSFKNQILKSHRISARRIAA